MSVNLQKELESIRQELRKCMSKTLPSKEYGATIILAMVGLHITEAEVRKTQNMIERRRLIHEFNDQKNTIQRSIQLLWKCNGSKDKEKTKAFKRAVS